jgi:hypothetical protein
MLCMFMLVFECCYSASMYVILQEYVLLTECLFYSPNVVILGILLFVERFTLFSERLCYCHML